MVHKGNALVHVSGHASAGELLFCYNIVRPRNVMPVHGETRVTWWPTPTLPSPPGCRAEADDHRRGRHGHRPAARPGPDRRQGTRLRLRRRQPSATSELSLTDRRILGEEGFISVITVINTHASKIISGPDIHARGFVEDDGAFDACAR